MKEELLYFVAVPYTKEILDLATLFSIETNDYHVINKDPNEAYGLFIYSTYLGLENVDVKGEWLLSNNDAAQVLALYASEDFNSICEYLNAIPDRPFNVYYDKNYLNYRKFTY